MEAGVSMTGSPNRVALVATPLSGVIGMPASAWLADGPTPGDGGAAAVDNRPPGFLARACGFLRGASILTGGSVPWFCATCAGGGAVCARPGPAAKSATAVNADVEMRRERNAVVRSRVRPLSMTGNMPRLNGETVTRHRDFGCCALCHSPRAATA
jgi:hypothetical protein